MAELAATVLEKAVLIANDQLQEFEMRVPEVGVYDAFAKYNQLVPAETITGLRKSASRPIEIAVFNRETKTILDERTPVVHGGNSTTAKMGLSWSTFGFATGITESINSDNYMTAARDLANQIAQSARDMFTSIDAYLTGLIEAGKYSSLPASTLMAIDSGAYTAELIELWIKAPAVMRKLMLKGPYQVISNVESLATQNLMSTYGAQNSQNLEKLLTTNYQFSHSPNVSAGTDQEVHYMIPQGSLQMLSWVEDDCRKRHGSYDAGEYYDMVQIEFKSLTGVTYSIPMGYLYQAKPVDKSAVRSGLERAYTKGWDFFVDVAGIKAYSSEAGKSPIVKFKGINPA